MVMLNDRAFDALMRSQAFASDKALVRAGVAEYMRVASDPLWGEAERSAACATVRGLMLRCGVYEQFVAEIETQSKEQN